MKKGSLFLSVQRDGPLPHEFLVPAQVTEDAWEPFPVASLPGLALWAY